MTTGTKTTFKFYPSSSAFMLGDVVVTKYESGCLRHILIRSRGISAGDIPELYQRVGAFAEDKHAADLRAKELPFIREVSIRVPLSTSVQYSGRADFIVTLPDGPIVEECKGHVSKNTRRDVIRKGEWNVGYLAQLVSYMVKLRIQRGRLVCGYFEEETDGVFVRQENREFLVTISVDGGIEVDGEPSGYCVEDLLSHQSAAVRVMKTGEIASRPDKWNQKWGGPCQYCPFKPACDYYDACGGTTEEFLEAAQHAADNAPTKAEPVINKVKQSRKARKPA